MDSIRKFINPSDEQRQEEGGVLSEISGLSWSTRLKGFGICLAVAFLFGIGAGIAVFSDNGLVAFAVLYSFSVIFGVGSTFFLIGPTKQMKQMFDRERIIATIVFLVSVVMTLLSALVFKNVEFLVLIFVIIQFLALAWYTITYIPFARQMITGCCRRAMDG